MRFFSFCISRSKFAFYVMTIAIVTLQGCAHREERSLSQTEGLSDESLTSLIFKNNFAPKIHGQYKHSIEQLPVERELKITPWSNVWSDNTGGIAKRFNLSQLPQNYEMVSEAEFYSLSETKASSLSPAEKFDILNGDFNYPTLKAEIERTGIRRLNQKDKEYQPGYSIPNWLSLDKYIAAASIVYGPFENLDSITSSVNNIEIKFSNDELLGLLGLQMLYNNFEREVVASACSTKSVRVRNAFFSQSHRKGMANLNNFYEGLNSINSKAGCVSSINPSAFHLAITNEIGLELNPLIFEKLDNRFSLEGVAYGYKMEKTNVIDGVEISLYLDIYNDVKKYHTKLYKYRLVLDSKSRVVGGVWLSKDYPELIWKPSVTSEIAGYYSTLNKLLKKTTKSKEYDFEDNQ